MWLITLDFLRATGQSAAMTTGSNINVNARLLELAEILATGLIRLQGLKSSGKSLHPGESSLDFNRHQSGHPHALTGGELDG
jgi:hypothetical protein